MQSDPQYSYYNLPPSLEVALQRFGKWSDAQLSHEQDDVTPTTPLFHYTSREALKGILENRYLWCFSHAQQDDKEEFQYSLGIARNELKHVQTNGDEFAKEFAICVADLIEKNDLTNVFNFYLFSVSAKRDSELQWKQYGRGGTGFSIGFAPKLFLPDVLTLSPRANENAHVGRVVYGDSKTIYRHRKVIKRAAEITHQVAAINRGLFRRESVHVEYVNAMAKEYIARQLVWRSLTAKRSCWEHQSEVRFVVMNQRKNFDCLEKTHTDGRRYVTYALPLLEPGSIAEIMIGPAAPSDAESWLSKLLNYLGYSGVPVVRSTQSLIAPLPVC
jgi:hypothetical protein